MKPLLNEEQRHKQKPSEIQSKYVASVHSPVIQYFEVEPKFIKVFFKAHNAEINDIEAEYQVKVPRETKGGKTSLIPTDACSTEEYEKACDVFIDFYQQMTQIMKMERLSLESQKNVVPARKKLQEIGKKFPVVVEVGRDLTSWELYGEEHHLEEALEFLERERVGIKRESKHGKGTEEYQGWRDLDLGQDVNQPNSPTGVESKQLLETYIGK